MSGFKQLRKGLRTEVVSPLSIVRRVTTNPPGSDRADPSVLDLESGMVLWLLSGIYVAAHGAYTKALEAGEVAAKAATKFADGLSQDAREARRELREARGERKVARGKKALAYELLKGRLRRTRLSRNQAGLVLCGVALGEVALNASAAIGQGDVVWLSVVAFVGVGASTIGIGMAAAGIREGVDQIKYQRETVPEGAEEAGIAHFFVPARRLRATWAVPSVVLVAAMATLGLAVAALRASGGYTSWFGVFTGITIAGAAAISYVNADPVRDLFENLDSDLAKLDQRVKTLGATAGAWRAARSEAKSIRAAAAHEARAQWDIVLAEGLTTLPVHIFGHAGSGTLLAISPEEFESGDWRKKAQAVVNKEGGEKNGLGDKTDHVNGSDVAGDKMEEEDQSQSSEPTPVKFEGPVDIPDKETAGPSQNGTKH
jgi:hypothetical protein